MGTSITTQVQIQTAEGWVNVEDELFKWYGEGSHQPFAEQNYGLFAFLADVRNYACLPVLSQPRGLPAVEKPQDSEGWGAIWEFNRPTDWPDHEGHYSKTWYLVSELLNFDYDAQFENRRNENCGDEPLPVGSGKITTIREYIGPKFFEDLETLRLLGEPDKTRVVISFES